MRIVKADTANMGEPGIVMVDWRASPDVTAEQIDLLLREHGLGIVSHFTGCDTFFYSIEKIA